MNITVTTEGSKTTFSLDGKLTVQTSPDLSNAIDSIDANVCDLDFDLTDVSYISSAGLRVLVAAHKLAASRGGVVRLLHPCPEVSEVFEMTGLSTVFTIEA